MPRNWRGGAVHGWGFVLGCLVFVYTLRMEEREQGVQQGSRAEEGKRAGDKKCRAWRQTRGPEFGALGKGWLPLGAEQFLPGNGRTVAKMEMTVK